MSTQTFEKIRDMASELSPVEQTSLFVWLGNVLQIEHFNSTAIPHQATIKKTKRNKKPAQHNSKLDPIRTTPKTGAEIAAMLESGEISTQSWVELDIPDSVAWLKELREQQAAQRGVVQW